MGSDWRRNGAKWGSYVMIGLLAGASAMAFASPARGFTLYVDQDDDGAGRTVCVQTLEQKILCAWAYAKIQQRQYDTDPNFLYVTANGGGYCPDFTCAGFARSSTTTFGFKNCDWTGGSNYNWGCSWGPITREKGDLRSWTETVSTTACAGVNEPVSLPLLCAGPAKAVASGTYIG